MKKIKQVPPSESLPEKNAFKTYTPNIGFAAGLQVPNLRLRPASPDICSKSAESTLARSVTPLPSLSSSRDGEENDENDHDDEEIRSPCLYSSRPKSRELTFLHSQSPRYAYERVKSLSQMREELRKKQLSLKIQKTSSNIAKYERNPMKLILPKYNQGEGCGDEKNKPSQAASETTAREFILSIKSKLKNIPQTYLDACMEMLERFEKINRDSHHMNPRELKKHIQTFQSQVDALKERISEVKKQEVNVFDECLKEIHQIWAERETFRQNLLASIPPSSSKFRRPQSSPNISKSPTGLKREKSFLKNIIKEPTVNYSTSKIRVDSEKQIQELKSQKESIELELFETNEKLSALMIDHEQLVKELNIIKNENKYPMDNDEMRKRIMTLQTVNRSLESRLNSTNSKLNQCLETIRNYEQEMKNLTERSNRFSKQVVTIKGVKSNLEEANNHFKKRIHDLEVSYKAIEDDNRQLKADLRTALDQRVSEKSKLENQLEEGRGITKRVKMALDRAQKEVVQKRDEEKSAKKERQELEAKICQLEASLKRSQERERELAVETEESRRFLEKETETSNELRGQLNQVKEIVVNLEHNLRILIGGSGDSEIKSDVDIFSQFAKTIEKAGEKIQFLDSCSKESETKLENTNQMLEKEIETLNNRIDILNQEKDELVKTLESSRSELRKMYLAELDITETAEHLKALRLEYSKLSNKYESSQKKIQALSEQLDAAEERMYLQIEAKQRSHEVLWAEAQAQKEKLMMKINEAEKLIARKEEEIIKQHRMNENLEIKILESEKYTKKLEATELESQETISLLKLNLNNLEIARANLENEIAELQSKETRLQEEKLHLKEQISEVEMNLHQMTEARERECLESQNELKETNNKFQNEFTNLKNHYENEILEYSEVKQQIEKQFRECEKRMRDIEEMKNYRINELEQTINQLVETRDELVKQLTNEKENRKNAELDAEEKYSILQQVQAEKYNLIQEKNELLEKMKNFYNNKSSFEEQITQMKNRDLEFNTHLSNVNAELEAERESKQHILNEIDELRNENNELKTQLEHLKFKPNIPNVEYLNELQMRLQQAEQETQMTQWRVRALTDELLRTRESSELTIRALRKQIGIITQQKRKLKERLEGDQDKIDNLAIYKAAADVHIKQTRLNVDAIRAEDRNRIKKLEIELNEAQTEIEKLSKIIDSENNERHYRQSPTNDRGDIQEISVGVQVAELQKLLRDRENRISQLIQDKESFLQTIQYAKELEAAGDIGVLREQLTAEIVSRDEQINKLKQQCRSLEKYNVECEENIRALERQLIDLQNYIKSIREKPNQNEAVKELIDINQKCAEVQKQLSQALRERDELEQFLARKYREIEIRDREMNCLREKLVWTEKKLLTLNNELDVNRNYITKLKVEKIASSQHCREIYKRMDEKNDELRKLKRLVKRLQKTPLKNK